MQTPFSLLLEAKPEQVVFGHYHDPRKAEHGIDIGGMFAVANPSGCALRWEILQTKHLHGLIGRVHQSADALPMASRIKRQTRITLPKTLHSDGVQI